MRLLADQAGDVTKSIVGTVTNPLPAYGSLTTPGGGIILLLSNILRLVFVVAGIYAFINFIIAGFQYMQAGGDSKALGSAWNRIWRSLLGLLVIVGSFALAAVFGQLLFNNPMYILSPQIYGPK